MMNEKAGCAYVKANLGDDCEAVRFSGYWVIGTLASGTWEKLSPEPLRKNIDKAIADVLLVRGAA